MWAVKVQRKASGWVTKSRIAVTSVEERGTYIYRERESFMFLKWLMSIRISLLIFYIIYMHTYLFLFIDSFSRNRLQGNCIRMLAKAVFCIKIIVKFFSFVYFSGSRISTMMFSRVYTTHLCASPSWFSLLYFSFCSLVKLILTF